GVSTSVELSEITTDCPTITICGEETKIVDVTNSTTGDTWMDRNLGASQTADSSRDYNAYGALFQWGRLSDGHECINWTSSTSGTPVNGNTNITSSVDNPGHSLFITAGSSSDYDWRSPQNNDLWQEVSGTNNPCPDGYRLPTETELDVERASWSSNDADGAFDSPLKLTLTGNHNYSGLITNVGTNGQCWSSTVDGIYGKRMYYASNYAIINSIYRAFGFSVRCIKD
ncbi:MAG: FISUMP domain-containing protein, partial [Bacteroidota bacterium]|nr:FISUMP domain-containing protein [Bacteroidota bacterium]